ncbi:MAG TPA: beta-propeller fold lactonase family protein, partial [Chthoniobacterales bacterium]
MKAWFFAAMVMASPVRGQGMDAYIGTYTTPDAPGGIYAAQFDPETGKWREPRLAAKAKNPAFLALGRKTLYAAIETDPGAVRAYAIGPRRTLTFLNEQPSGGDGACHVSVDAAGKHVLIANYGGGSAAVFPVRADGSLGARSDLAAFQGSGPNPRRQRKSYGHAVNAWGDFVYA